MLITRGRRWSRVEVDKHNLMIATYRAPSTCIKPVQKRQHIVRAPATVGEVADTEQPVFAKAKTDASQGTLQEVVGSMKVSNHKIAACLVAVKAAHDTAGITHGARRDIGLRR